LPLVGAPVIPSPKLPPSLSPLPPTHVSLSLARALSPTSPRRPRRPSTPSALAPPAMSPDSSSSSLPRRFLPPTRRPPPRGVPNLPSSAMARPWRRAQPCHGALSRAACLGRSAARPRRPSARRALPVPPSARPRALALTRVRPIPPSVTTWRASQAPAPARPSLSLPVLWRARPAWRVAPSPRRAPLPRPRRPAPSRRGGPGRPVAAFPSSAAPPHARHARPWRRGSRPWCPARRGAVQLGQAWPRCLTRGVHAAQPRRGSFTARQHSLARARARVVCPVSWRGSSCSRRDVWCPTMLVTCPSTPPPLPCILCALIMLFVLMKLNST
jgi:hypothetical protein